MAPPPLPSLVEELVEEILLRLRPDEPASLIRAAAVCKRWRRLISSPRFRLRFLELHRTPPMLGFICNYNHSRCSIFVHTSASSPLRSNTTTTTSTTGTAWCALDARHGRVLLRDALTVKVRFLVVWDPITDEHWKLPAVPWPTASCTAAVLCATAACDHRGCHRGPFRVVFVGTEPGYMFVCTFSSDVGVWSHPVSIQHLNNRYYTFGGYSPSVLLKNDVYFGIPMTNTVLKYDLELRKNSWIQLPALQHYGLKSSVLMATEDGELGLVRVRLSDGRLCIWSRMDTHDEANGGWTQFKVVDLGTQLDVRPGIVPKTSLVGSADGLGIVFMTVDGTLYTVHLKTNMVKKIDSSGTEMDTVFPYMRFYSPALEAAPLGEEPSAAGSSA